MRKVAAYIVFFLRNPMRLITVPLSKLSYFSFDKDTANYQNRSSVQSWIRQKVWNKNGHRNVYWPVHDTSTVYDPERIIVGVDTCPGNMGGCYIQGKGGIEIGDYTQIAPNVVIISANHDLYDARKHIAARVKIGSYCWLGAGAKIMPGVVLGDNTVVAAGAVVTKSFPSGYCVLAGVPANVIKELDPSLCVHYEHEKKYHGFIRDDKFQTYLKKLRHGEHEV